jgi:hypothetical protein
MMLAWYRLHGEALGLVLSRSSVAGGVAWLVLMLVVDLLAVAVSLLFLGVITAPIFGR